MIETGSCNGTVGRERLHVGVIAGRGWAVIEQNSAWGSGIYGCDPEQVLQVLRFAAVRAELSKTKTKPKGSTKPTKKPGTPTGQRATRRKASNRADKK